MLQIRNAAVWVKIKVGLCHGVLRSIYFVPSFFDLVHDGIIFFDREGISQTGNYIIYNGCF